MIPASVSQSVARLYCTDTAERIRILFEAETDSQLRTQETRHVISGVLGGGIRGYSNTPLRVVQIFPTDWMRPSPNYFGHLFNVKLRRN